MERDQGWKSSEDDIINFNSHAHVERDTEQVKDFADRGISTHTLTWSVTRHERSKRYHTRDFNSHAHVERDLDSIESSSLSKDFNSHAHVERDYSGDYSDWCILNFNSHAHVERDVGEIVRNWINAQFQLTRSRGA